MSVKTTVGYASRIAILQVVCVCCFLNAFAQSSSSEPPKEVIERPTVDSPQVWSMMRYDNPSVSLNTGSPYITIPLVDENDPDFDFKYSLVYSTPGFRPWEPDNYVGMGWILEGDGVIRREIRGIPDDCQNLPTGPHTASQSRMVSGFRISL